MNVEHDFGYKHATLFGSEYNSIGQLNQPFWCKLIK